MSTLIFRLRGVPEEEARDIQTLLSDNGIDWYTTDAGNWGIALPAIWLKNDGDRADARRLIDAYQQQRQQLAREAYDRQRMAGELPGLWQQFARHPARSLAIVLFSAFVLYLMIRPFVDLALAPSIQ